MVTVMWVEPAFDSAGREIEEIVDYREFPADADGEQQASALAAVWTREASTPTCVTITTDTTDDALVAFAIEDLGACLIAA